MSTSPLADFAPPLTTCPLARLKDVWHCGQACGTSSGRSEENPWPHTGHVIRRLVTVRSFAGAPTGGATGNAGGGLRGGASGNADGTSDLRLRAPCDSRAIRSNMSGSNGSVPAAIGVAAGTEAGSTSTAAAGVCRLVSAAVRRFESPVSSGAYSSLSWMFDLPALGAGGIGGSATGATGIAGAEGADGTGVATGMAAAFAEAAVATGSQRC